MKSISTKRRHRTSRLSRTLANIWNKKSRMSLLLSSAVLPSYIHLTANSIGYKPISTSYNRSCDVKKRSIHLDNIVGCAKDFLDKFNEIILLNQVKKSVKSKNRSTKIYNDDNLLMFMNDKIDTIDISHENQVDLKFLEESWHQHMINEENSLHTNAIDFIDLTSFSYNNTIISSHSIHSTDVIDSFTMDSSNKLDTNLKHDSAATSEIALVPSIQYSCVWPFGSVCNETTDDLVRSVSSSLKLSACFNSSSIDSNDEADESYLSMMLLMLDEKKQNEIFFTDAVEAADATAAASATDQNDYVEELNYLKRIKTSQRKSIRINSLNCDEREQFKLMPDIYFSNSNFSSSNCHFNKTRRSYSNEVYEKKKKGKEKKMIFYI